MYVARGGGGGHSLVWLARPYDLIAEGVKVGWSYISHFMSSDCLSPLPPIYADLNFLLPH